MNYTRLCCYHTVTVWLQTGKGQVDAVHDGPVVNNSCEGEYKKLQPLPTFWLKRVACADSLTAGKVENSLFQKIKENNIC